MNKNYNQNNTSVWYPQNREDLKALASLQRRGADVRKMLSCYKLMEELSNRGYTEDHLRQELLEIDEETNPWTKRYKIHGELWGKDYSTAGRYVSEHVTNNSTVLDVGAGYGRDTILLARKGCNVVAVEDSTEGLTLIKRQIDAENLKHKAQINGSDLLTAHVEKKSFDFVLASRVWHLNPPSEWGRMAQKAHDSLKNGGQLVMTVRSTDDFNSDMEWIEEGLSAKYRTKVGNEERPQYPMYFFNEERLIETFKPYFNILSLESRQEPEACTNPGKVTNLFFIVAEKIASPANGKGHNNGYNNGAPHSNTSNSNGMNTCQTCSTPISLLQP